MGLSSLCEKERKDGPLGPILLNSRSVHSDLCAVGRDGCLVCDVLVNLTSLDRSIQRLAIDLFLEDEGEGVGVKMLSKDAEIELATRTLFDGDSLAV